MVVEPMPASDLRRASLSRVIGYWALRTSAPTLLSLLLITGIGAVALSLFTHRFEPIAGIAGTLSSIAAWGLLAQHLMQHPAAWATWLQRLLVVVGVVLATLAALPVFFALLGPHAWTL